jgi:DNA-directed RNA polymerase specialized sigma24 family protein
MWIMTEARHSTGSSQSGVALRAGPFVTTHWSLVLTAGSQETARAQSALEVLCRAYWGPLYSYVRRRGYSIEDAQDMTQAFFGRLLERRWLACAEREKGRFRTFLLTAMERFLANEWDKARALKRGGGHVMAPIQLDAAETRYGVDPQDTRTPEQAFEQRWAVTLLDEVLNRLEAEFHARGQAGMFATLKPCLVGDRAAQPYANLAERLKMREGAVKVAVHRLRHRYRELLRSEIAETVACGEDVDSEMRHLFEVLAGRV